MCLAPCRALTMQQGNKRAQRLRFLRPPGWGDAREGFVASAGLFVLRGHVGGEEGAGRGGLDTASADVAPPGSLAPKGEGATAGGRGSRQPSLLKHGKLNTERL